MIRAMGHWLGMVAFCCVPAMAGEWVQEGADSFSIGLFAGTEIDSLGRVSLASFRGANLALGAVASSGPNTLSGRRSVTDGNTDTEWRFDNEVEVLGKWIRLDLGGDRGVSQVRLLPGKTVTQRPLFFVKGYRLEVAREATPDDWILVAQQAENTRPTVDTSVDSTWIETSADGAPLPVLGRFVRLRLTREDPPNWVSIGEVEVFGEGFRAEGTFESAVFDAGQPVNFGKVWFAGETPPGTVLRVQFRTSADGVAWPEWHRVAAWDLAEVGDGVALTEPEPARFVQYRAVMETRDPLSAPRLMQVAVAFGEQLFARAVAGAIAPLRPMLGEETAFTYTLDVQIGPEDLGFDRVHIGLPGVVQQVRFDGLVLPEDVYEAGWDDEGLWLVLGAEHEVSRSGRLEVEFASVLLRPTLAVRAAVALGDSADWQHVRPEEEDAWTLVGEGVVSRALPRAGVSVRPNPFNATSGATQIQIDLAKVQHPQALTVALYDLAGRKWRMLWDGQAATAGRKRLAWDGRDESGRLVAPGHYLLRVAIDADHADVWTGLVGVVY
ncbi:MAG: discoidin domain-containing protein [Gemmatimonadetes bacterium]|nr:discoidin domain-containing protein [Gemmatimonadota bacterium]